MKVHLWGGPRDGDVVNVPPDTVEYRIQMRVNGPNGETTRPGIYRHCPLHVPVLFEWTHYGENPVRRDSDSEDGGE